MKENNLIDEEHSKIITLAHTILEDQLDHLTTSQLNDFLATLRTSTSNETKGLILRALERIVIRPQINVHQSQIIHNLIPLLRDPSLSLRIQISTCLFECLNVTPSSVVHPYRSNIFQSLSTFLASSDLNLSFTATSSGVLRLISNCLQIYDLLLIEDNNLLPEIVNSLIPHISNYIYYRPGVGGSTTPLAGRGRSTSSASLSFGVMGSFLPSGPKKSSGSSIRSSSISSVKGYESEDDSMSANKKLSSVDIRKDSLSILHKIAEKDPKLLFSHWSHFFSDSPYLKSKRTLLDIIETDPVPEIRLKACKTLCSMLDESISYLAIAEDRPTKASFTSLSSKLGEIVSELHLKLASILSTPSSSNSPDLRVAILRVASTLGLSSPYTRMKRSLAEPLVKSILPYLDNRDERISVAACRALGSIVVNIWSGKSIGVQVLDFVGIGVKATQILETTEVVELRTDLYTLLASLISIPSSGVDVLPALAILQRDFYSVNTVDLEKQGFFVDSVFRTSTSTAELVPFKEVLLAATKLLIASNRPASKIYACSILANERFEELNSSIKIYAEIFRLTWDDEDVGVKNAASRSLGLLVKSTNFPSATEDFPRCLKMCLIHCADVGTKSTASWTFANCCDAMTFSHSLYIGLSQKVELALELTSSTNSEKIRTNGIRAIGSLLRLSNGTSLVTEDHISNMVSALCEGHRVGGSAKLRWNASAAIGNALSNEKTSRNRAFASILTYTASAVSLTPLQINTLIQALLVTLVNDANFKVRIQAVSSLILLGADREIFGEEFKGVCEIVESTRERLKEEEDTIALKEKEHSRQLSERLSLCSDLLSKLAVDT